MRQLGRIYNTARRYQPGGETEAPSGVARLNPGFTPKLMYPYDVEYVDDDGNGLIVKYNSSYPHFYPEKLLKASESGEYTPEEIKEAKLDFLESEEGRNYKNDRTINTYEDQLEGLEDRVPANIINTSLYKFDDNLERPRKEAYRGLFDDYYNLKNEHLKNNPPKVEEEEEEELPMLGKDDIYSLWKEVKDNPGYDKSIIDDFKKRWLESEEGKKWKDDYRQETKRLMSKPVEHDMSAFEAEPYEVTPERVNETFGLKPYEHVDMDAYTRETPEEEEFDEDLGVTNYNDLYNNASRKDLRKLAHGKGWQNAEGKSLVGVDDRRTGRQYARSVRRGRREDLRNGANGNPYRNQAEVDEAIRERRGRYGKGGSLVRYYLSVLGR